MNTKYEHAQWQTICRMLLEAGAVTPKDLESSVRLTKTSGQRLLVALREWGVERETQGKVAGQATVLDAMGGKNWGTDR